MCFSLPFSDFSSLAGTTDGGLGIENLLELSSSLLLLALFVLYHSRNLRRKIEMGSIVSVVDHANFRRGCESDTRLDVTIDDIVGGTFGEGPLVPFGGEIILSTLW